MVSDKLNCTKKSLTNTIKEEHNPGGMLSPLLILVPMLPALYEPPTQKELTTWTKMTNYQIDENYYNYRNTHATRIRELLQLLELLNARTSPYQPICVDKMQDITLLRYQPIHVDKSNSVCGNRPHKCHKAPAIFATPATW